MIAMLEEFIQYALGKGAWIAPFRDVLERVQAQPSMAGYIKRLVREDIAREISASASK